MPGTEGRNYDPSSSVCETFHPLYIRPDPFNSQMTLIRNDGGSIIEVEYSQLNGAGKPFTHRYIHLKSGEDRQILNVGFSECVTSARSSWTKGPSATGKFSFGKINGAWRVENHTNHYIAVRADILIKSSYVGPAIGSTVYVFQTVPPASTKSVWPGLDDEVTIGKSFEDVYPFSKP